MKNDFFGIIKTKPEWVNEDNEKMGVQMLFKEVSEVQSRRELCFECLAEKRELLHLFCEWGSFQHI